jgi:hypothetical protein
MTHDTHQILLTKIGGTPKGTEGDKEQRKKIQVGRVIRLKDPVEHLFDEERYDAIGGTESHHAEQSPDKGATVRLKKLLEPLLEYATGRPGGSCRLKHQPGDLVGGWQWFAKGAVFGDCTPFERMTNCLKPRAD